jgi:hypothetical protein
VLFVAAFEVAPLFLEISFLLPAWVANRHYPEPVMGWPRDCREEESKEEVIDDGVSQIPTLQRS